MGATATATTGPTARAERAPVYNFSSGPAVLPAAVLAEAQRELRDWGGRGYSVMETSHRSADFVALLDDTEARLRTLAGIPDHYRVLFLQGGAHLQFAMVPLNLLGAKTCADYVIDGIWSAKAADEAERFAAVRRLGVRADARYRATPDAADLAFDPAAAYVHYCSNETIEGIEFAYVPAAGNLPLVADMSSHFLSRPLDVAAHALIYAGAQKNFGPAGLTVVIVRDDLLGQCSPRWPTMLDYRTHAAVHGGYNTPPTFAIYVANLVLRWLAEQGGLAGIERANVAKARLLYDTIDASGFYRNEVRVADRSRMNVPFSLADPRLDTVFLEEAGAAGLEQLKGHRLVGGMRASIYNAMPLAGVQALTRFMHAFERRHG